MKGKISITIDGTLLEFRDSLPGEARFWKIGISQINLHEIEEGLKWVLRL